MIEMIDEGDAQEGHYTSMILSLASPSMVYF
ncbi:hypothetical protein CFP56_035960 [Quercus suber]|uniref:Uncharacterized protein n=1 Tax=Quercus suber TaxID=58331 RepID=A0AAW0J811_QUESU